MSKTIIIIPSRLAAKRLPNKPLLKINKKTIISIVYKKALRTKLGEVYVATGDKKIYDEIKSIRGKCILTKKHHKTGSDRIFEALEILGNKKKYKYVLNIQGDEPMFNILDVKNLHKQAIKKNFRMGTLACKLVDENKLMNKNVVKVETKKKLFIGSTSIADGFHRAINPKIKNNIYHHIGVYIYQLSILKKIFHLKQTYSEKKHKLEQLRPLENFIPINVVLAKKVPIGVDTKKDYNFVRKLLEKKN
tara:strand:- start:11 stop:754 length:744 start_codon:yes stop_codon:yes gene_type:complete